MTAEILQRLYINPDEILKVENTLYGVIGSVTDIAGMYFPEKEYKALNDFDLSTVTAERLMLKSIPLIRLGNKMQEMMYDIVIEQLNNLSFCKALDITFEKSTDFNNNETLIKAITPMGNYYNEDISEGVYHTILYAVADKAFEDKNSISKDILANIKDEFADDLRNELESDSCSIPFDEITRLITDGNTERFLGEWINKEAVNFKPEIERAQKTKANVKDER